MLWDSDGAANSYNVSSGFRPVFLLTSNVVINSGDGSSGNPYVISSNYLSRIDNQKY